MPLAEFNFGTLKYPWDDPRLADFQDNLARVNALAQRSPGFIWMMPEDEMDRAQTDLLGPLAQRPNTASTLSVWTDAASLCHFVDQTLHSRFLARGAEWFAQGDRSHLVVWEIPPGARPSVAEGFAQWEALMTEGETETRFGGRTLRQRAEAVQD